MAKVIIISQTFPKYHPRAGKKTGFVEKILNGFNMDYWEVAYLNLLLELNAEKIADVNSRLTKDDIKHFWKKLEPAIWEQKHHTIRAGNRFADGEFCSPRCWSCTPYDSPQIIFLPATTITATWPIEKYLTEEGGQMIYDWHFPNAKGSVEIQTIAENDGLTKKDFQDWFAKEFKGQVICWNSKINY